jgi:hypothetical protein
MQLGNQGTAFLPDGGTLPGGPCPVYLELEVTEDGGVTGEVHFFSEPKFPRPISIGREFDLHVPRPDSILGENVVLLRVRFADDSGAIVGYAHGSRAQFHPRKGDMARTEPRTASDQGLLVFISHSSKDAELAQALIDLLKDALGLRAHQIRCSSVDGHRLPVGVNTESKLRDEVNAAIIVIGLVTPSSLDSSFVMFELGARWGANLFLAPLMAGVKPSGLNGPLSLLNALDATNEAQLLQLVEDISGRLDLPLQSAASYLRRVAQVKELAQGVSGGAPERPVSAASRLDLVVTLSAEGTPPSQVLKVAANQSVAVSRVEYMSSSEACIAGEDVSMRGATIEVPVNDGLLLKLWNTPRSDRSAFDGSGPAQIGVTVSNDEKTRHYILPVQLEAALLGSTMYRKIVGSKTFREG